MPHLPQYSYGLASSLFQLLHSDDHHDYQICHTVDYISHKTPRVDLKSYENYVRMDSIQSLSWRLVTWIQICATLNQRKAKKTEPSSLIPPRLAANVELLNATFQRALNSASTLLVTVAGGMQ